jgi:hypothetical protein
LKIGQGWEKGGGKKKNCPFGLLLKGWGKNISPPLFPIPDRISRFRWGGKFRFEGVGKTKILSTDGIYHPPRKKIPRNLV